MHLQTWYLHILNFTSCHQQETKNSPQSSNQNAVPKNPIHPKLIHLPIEIGPEQEQTLPSEEQRIKIKNQKGEREQDSKPHRQHKRCIKGDYEDVGGSLEAIVFNKSQRERVPQERELGSVPKRNASEERVEQQEAERPVEQMIDESN